VIVLIVGIIVILRESAPPDTAPPRDPLVERGERIFFEETFEGNGRTCGSCHPAENNFTLDSAFIATLPANDPLFVAEFTPALKNNFEKPELMRGFGLILENLDGFGDLANKFVLRGIPHVLAQRTSVQSPNGPRTGWSGDGAPGDGSLRSFAVGAVIQHFTKSLNRVAGVDFRLPTDEELDALEAFMLSLGRQEELKLPLRIRGEVPRRGQEIFLDDALGKCNRCHQNAGANAAFGGANNNANFNTGVEDLPDQPARLTGARIPRDDGLGSPGDGTFNTPPLVEAADSGPFFHNNSIETIEGAVAFYNGQAFNNSPAGRALAGNDPNGVGIRLDATQVVAVAAFLRVLNALENIREADALLQAGQGPRGEPNLKRALAEIRDSARVLEGGGLHPQAVADLRQAEREADKALRSKPAKRGARARDARAFLAKARTKLIEE
jgi:mono/diheme cytochrome c family protein